MGEIRDIGSDARPNADSVHRRVVLLDNHPNDSRVTIRVDGIVQSLTSRCGTGGGNIPMIIEYENICGEEIL